jgi:hypothetical protein
MKKFLATVLVFSTITSSHALIIGADDNSCTGEYWIRDAFFCALTLTTSLPTSIVAADVKEMSEVEKESFLKAEAANYLDGVEGEYVILRVAAESMKLTMEEVALNIVNK